MTMTDTQRAAEDVRRAIEAADERARLLRDIHALSEADQKFVVGYAAGVLAAQESKTA